MSMSTATRQERRLYITPCSPTRRRARYKKRTGQPEWFRQMTWEARRKGILKKLPVSQLYDKGICTGSQVIALAESGYDTVWDVVDSSYKRLLRVPGFGPKTLAKLKQDAKIKGQLDMNWTVPSGR